MTATFVVYIDESGDEGFAFGKGSSDWFVLSAVIVRKANDLPTVKLVDDIRARLGRPPKSPVHFRDLKHEQRLPFVDAISKADVRLVSVLAHKPSLKEPEKFRERYRLYFYAVRYLLERVSWYCRDHKTSHDVGDGSAELVFSNRSGMSYDELREYIRLLETQSGSGFDMRIEWSVIRANQITAYSPIKRMGLHIADAVASSLFYAVQLSRYGFTEDRYAKLLKQAVYHNRGQYLGYGLKFWPKETDALLATDEFRWIVETFRK